MSEEIVSTGFRYINVYCGCLNVLLSLLQLPGPTLKMVLQEVARITGSLD